MRRIRHYYNLTLKMMAIMRWTLINCPNVKFIQKIDDDCFVIPNNLLKFCENTEKGGIYGYYFPKKAIKEWRPNDHFDHKWAYSRDDWENEYFPHFIAGPILIRNSILLE